MHTEDFTIFSLDLNFARCLVIYMPSSLVGVNKPLVIASYMSAYHLFTKFRERMMMI